MRQGLPFAGQLFTDRGLPGSGYGWPNIDRQAGNRLCEGTVWHERKLRVPRIGVKPAPFITTRAQAVAYGRDRVEAILTRRRSFREILRGGDNDRDRRLAPARHRFALPFFPTMTLAAAKPERYGARLLHALMSWSTAIRRYRHVTAERLLDIIQRLRTERSVVLPVRQRD